MSEVSNDEMKKTSEWEWEEIGAGSDADRADVSEQASGVTDHATESSEQAHAELAARSPPAEVPESVTSEQLGGSCEADAAADAALPECEAEAEPIAAATALPVDRCTVELTDQEQRAATLEAIELAGAVGDVATATDAGAVRELLHELSAGTLSMSDTEYAQKVTPSIPERAQKQKLKVLVTGQPETGRTTAVRNLFASITQDPAWQPARSEGSFSDFESNPDSFKTVIRGCKDTDQHLQLDFVIQETPGLRGDPAACVKLLADYVRQAHSAFATQEADVTVDRKHLVDERVDVVLYFLPTNARISELDLAVLRALGSLAPVIPVMCKADCLEEEEIVARKNEMHRLVAEGLPVFYPTQVLRRIAAMSGLLQPKAGAGTCPLQLPFNVVAGSHADAAVHPYWFVRKYRWGACEAFCSSNSELKMLRQLLLEEGFWALKDAAEHLYRSHVSRPPPSCLPPVELAAARRAIWKGAVPACGPTNGSSRSAAQPLDACAAATCGLRSAGRGSRLEPAAVHEVDSPPPLLNGAAACEAPARPAPPATSMFDSNPDFTVSDDECSAALRSLDTPASFGAPPTGPPSALARPPSPEPVPPPPPAPPVAQTTHSVQFAGVSAVVPPRLPADADGDDFSAELFREVSVGSVVKAGRNFRLSLRVDGGNLTVCMRIGEAEGGALQNVLQNIPTTRPSTYDMMASMLNALECDVVRALILDCSSTVFYGCIQARNRHSGAFVKIDARPSDAINLAVRFKAPVFLHQKVVDQYAR